MDKPKRKSKRYMIPKEILQKNNIKEEVGQTVTFSLKSGKKVSAIIKKIYDDLVMVEVI
ncbi:MAG: hypothetical protein KAT74_04255 [Candidatus Cloacimonetes bacterium]|nr:hypothetical protein [Candidatus Cloacimonadota bacterium]